VPEHYDALPQMQGNLLCAVDIETTGSKVGYHEVIQIAVQPLNVKYEPDPRIEPFYCNLKPLHPERVQSEAVAVHGLKTEDLLVYGLHPDDVREDFERWYGNLDLAFQRRLIMLGHNLKFEALFLTEFFGPDYFNEVFNSNSRDSLSLAIGINDTYVQHGHQAPFDRVSMSWLTNYFGIKNPKAHDALQDAITSAVVYQRLLTFRPPSF